MGSSRDIIESTLDSLAVYLQDNTIIYERYRQSVAEIEQREDIPRARVALYEQSEVVDVRVDDEKANLSRARYGMDISVVRAYTNDDASQGELPLADIRDAVVDWARSLNASTITGQRIYTFGYDGNTGITRTARYVTMTLAFTAIRDLHSTQS
jgi:hypothetical protein